LSLPSFRLFYSIKGLHKYTEVTPQPETTAAMGDENLWDSIKDLDATDVPAPKKAGWGLGAALSTFRTRGAENMGSHHGPTQTGLPTPPTSKSSHGTDPYNKPSLSNSNHNGHGGGGLWNRFGSQQQQEEDENNLDVGYESSSEGSFWKNLRKDHESDDEDTAYLNASNAGTNGIWNRVLGQPGDIADESDYDTDAGDDDWEQQKLESLQKLPGSMLDAIPPPPAPTQQKLSLSSKVPAAPVPYQAPTPPPPASLPIARSQEETDDEDDDEMIDDSVDDGDSVAPAGGGNADPLGDLGGLGAFLDKGNEQAFEAEMVNMMQTNKDDTSMADLSAIEGSVAPGEAKRLIEQRMQQRMDMSFGKSVCNMSLNPQEVETKERRPWRQQKHLRRGSALGAMPAGQLAMLGALAAEDSDSEEEDLYEMPTEINNERPVEVSQGRFDDVWKEGNATVMTERPEVTSTAMKGAGFLSRVPAAGEGFLPSGSASQQTKNAEDLTSLFPQTAEDIFPKKLDDKVAVEDLFAPQNMKSALPQADPLVGDSAHSSERRKKKSSSRASKPVEAEPEKPSSRSMDSKPRRRKSNEAKLEGDTEEPLAVSRKSSKRRDGSRDEDKPRSSRRDGSIDEDKPRSSRRDGSRDEDKPRGSRRDRSSRNEAEGDHKSSRRKSSRRHRSDDDNDDPGRKSSPRRHSSRRGEEGEVEASGVRRKFSRRRESKHNEHRSPRGRNGEVIDAELEGSRRRSKKPSSKSRPQSDDEGIDGSKQSKNRGGDRKSKDASAAEAVSEDFRGDHRSSRVGRKGSKGGNNHLEDSARHKDRKSRSRRKEEEDDEGDASDTGGELKFEKKPWRQPKGIKAGDGLDDMDGTDKHENTALSRLEERSRAASTAKKHELKKSESLIRDNSRQGTSSTGTGTTAETTGSLEFDDTDHQRKEVKRTGSIVAKHAAEAAKQPKKRGRLFAALVLKNNNHAKLEEDEDVNAVLLKQEGEGKARRRRSDGGDAKLPRGSQLDENKRGSKGETAGLLGTGGGASDGWGALEPDEDEKAADKKERRRRSTSVPEESTKRAKRKDGRRSTSAPRPKRSEGGDPLSESSRSHSKKKGSRDATTRRTKSNVEGDLEEKRERRKKPEHRHSSAEHINTVLTKDSSNARRKKSRSRPA
jgi:hypothetical protein